MLPIFLRLSFDTPVSQIILYVASLGLVAYIAYSGWRGAHGARDPKTGEFAPPTVSQRLQRAALYGILAAASARFGLHYALPAGVFLGSRGEGVPIHTYGIMLASGFIGAVTLSAELARREWRGEEGERKREQVLDLSFWVLISAIAGSKILFVLVNWNDYSGRWGETFSSPPKVLEFLSGGLVFYGGLLGAMLASFLYSRAHGINFLRLADLALPTVSFGQCLGRLGCFSSGCCWGDIAKAGVKTVVHFPGASAAKTLFGRAADTSSMAFQAQSTDARWVIESTAQIFHQYVPGAVQISHWATQHGYTLPVHPTQLYESLGQFVLFGAFLLIRRYRRFHGEIMALWLMSYAVLRTTVELFRGDVERGTLHGLLNDFLHLPDLAARIPLEAWYNISTSQFISLCMFAFGAVFLYRQSRRSNPVLRHGAVASA